MWMEEKLMILLVPFLCVDTIINTNFIVQERYFNDFIAILVSEIVFCHEIVNIQLW